MLFVKIFNKSKTKNITVKISDPRDAHDLMKILAKNDVPFVAGGDNGEGDNYGNQDHYR